MADEADYANEMGEFLLEKQIEEHKNRQEGARLRPTGKCFNCEDAVPEGALFCDKDCRDDFEKRQQRR